MCDSLIKNLMQPPSLTVFCAGATGSLPTLARRLKSTGAVAPRDDAVVLIAALRPSFFSQLTTLTLTQTGLAVMLTAPMMTMMLVVMAT